MKTFPSLFAVTTLLVAVSLTSLSFAQPPPGGPGFPGGPIPPRRPLIPIVPIVPLPPPYPHHPRRVVHSESDSTVAQVQRKLKKLGYYESSVDGEIGPKTRAAIRAYQEENSLEITGQIDKALLSSLGL
jgi:hypothetical protein